MAVEYHSRTRGPRAASRQAFRFAAQLPTEPLGVEVLAAIKQARGNAGRTQPWDARLESSAIAALTYLWRRGRGERWAGCKGSARYGCSLAQLVIGLAPIMGWQNLPAARDEAARRRFVKAHRKSVQRWLDWLELAGLITHIPQQDENGFWWRTIIELHPVPEIAPEALAEAIARRAGWRARERRRATRGRTRDLTVILRRARLTRTQRRARATVRRRQLRDHAQQVRVRGLVAASLAEAIRTHLTHPFGVSTTSRISKETNSQLETSDRRQAGARTRLPAIATASTASTPGTEEKQSGSQEDLRWTVYGQIRVQRFSRSDDEWELFLRSPLRRVAQLASWPMHAPAPPRWRLIEAWTVAAHGAHMSLAGGFRLAFWSEEEPHHGPRLERALRRYERHAAACPPGWPAGGVAGFAAFLANATPHQLEGPEHGMAYDVARFNELTKRMSAYAHYHRDDHLKRAEARAARRAQLRELAEQLNHRLHFRIADSTPGVRLRTAAELLDSEHPGLRAAGGAMYGTAIHQQRLDDRDRRLLAGQHPGCSDHRYLSACRHAKRWGLPHPPARREA